MSSITFHDLGRPGPTHGAALASQFALRVLGWLGSALHRRAEPPSTDERVREAARLRRFAQQVMADDPRFAADLFAAADQHERS